MRARSPAPRAPVVVVVASAVVAVVGVAVASAWLLPATVPGARAQDGSARLHLPLALRRATPARVAGAPSPATRPVATGTATPVRTSNPVTTPIQTASPTATASPVLTPTGGATAPHEPTRSPGATGTIPAAGIVVDHTSVDLFERIPGRYVDAAAALRMVFVDRSVGANIDDGLECLTSPSTAESPSRCRRTDHTVPEFSVTAADLAWSRPGGYDRSRWRYVPWSGGSCGAWYEMVSCFARLIEPTVAEYDVASFQFSYLEVNERSTIADPANGFFGRPARGDSVRDLESFEMRHPAVRTVYWTTSLARAIGTTESQAFNDQMRDYAASHGKPLFDVADILSHDHRGRPCHDNRDGVPYQGEDHPDDGRAIPAICQHYTTEAEGGHLGSVSVGRIRVAKAFWVLMARLAGWDGG